MTTKRKGCALGGGDKAMIRMVLGNVHVGTPDAEVRAEWEKRSDKAKVSPCVRKKVVAYALKCHHDNPREYSSVMGGGWGSSGHRKAKG